MYTSMTTLEMVLPRNHWLASRQRPGVSGSQPFRIGVHWKTVDGTAKRSHAVTRPVMTTVFIRKMDELRHVKTRM